MFFFVKSRNSQIFDIIKIMLLSKFAQKIYFYLIVASLYLIRSTLKMFIHSFISCWLLMNNFKPSSTEENITKSCVLEFDWFFWRYFPVVEILLKTFKRHFFLLRFRLMKNDL